MHARESLIDLVDGSIDARFKPFCLEAMIGSTHRFTHQNNNLLLLLHHYPNRWRR